MTAMGTLAAIGAGAPEIPRFDDGMVNINELVRTLAEALVNEIMDAQAEDACAEGNKRNGHRCSRRRVCQRGALCGQCVSPWERRTSGRGWRSRRQPTVRGRSRLRVPNQSCSKPEVLGVKPPARPLALLGILRGNRSLLACVGPGTIQRNLG